MRFWDSSAVVPMLVVEVRSAVVRSLAEADPAIVVWWTTRVECLSAIERRRREGALSRRLATQASRALAGLRGEWSEVLPTPPVRERAERLLAVHRLRTGDALQLAAALVWAGGSVTGRAFVCFDERLRDAAAAEGFDLVPESG